jgi:hypothetical protein
MKKAYTDILLPLIPNLIHNCCIAHIYNLVGETWSDFKEFTIVNNVVKNIKKAFVHSSARKRRWCEFLARNAISENLFPPELEFESSSSATTTLSLSSLPTSTSSSTQIKNILPPLPVKTRWCSWFRFVFWLCPHIGRFVSFFFKEATIDDSSKAIKDLVVIFSDQNNIIYLEIVALFLTFNAKR